MKLDLVAVKRIKYPAGSAGKEYAPGESFKALSERDAKVLVAVGRAKESTGKPKNRTDNPPRITNRAMTPETKAPDAPLSEPAPDAGRYSRRDLRPEE